MNRQNHMHELAAAARCASREVSLLSGEQRSRIVSAMADGIEQHAASILKLNGKDVSEAEMDGLPPAMIDRLRLDKARVQAMSLGLREVASLPNPLGKTIRTVRRPNGLEIRKISVPLGVVMIVYESRPNVTADAASICLMAGNAAILRGGSEALNSNLAILRAMNEAAEDAGLPKNALQLVPMTDRAAVRDLLQLDQLIDLVIPRGGEELIRAVIEHARMPVMKHSKGVCHVYVDRAADLDMGRRIAVNAKCQRPGVCNAMETLLVHADIADRFLPVLATDLAHYEVQLRCDSRAQLLMPGSTLAAENDWYNEYLDFILNVRVVSSVEEAMDHIERHGSRHSDAIVTRDDATADRFMQQVDSAAVYVNASTRFTDGSEFGMGAEIGISTDKFHARGPCGIEELTTYKYVIHGDGQIRS